MDAPPTYTGAGESESESESVHGGIEALRWMSFVAAIWVQAINGTNFDFSAYSSLLKEVLGISQVQLNNLAVASDLGKALGWLSGLASLYLPLWTVLSIAASLGFLGYGLQWLLLVRQIPVLPYWQVYLLCVMAGNSVCWFNTVCYIVCIRNFPSERGFVLGLSTSYAGLSAALYAALVAAIASGTESLYLLANAAVPAAVCALAAPFLRPREKPSPRPGRAGPAAIFYALATLTGAYLLALDLAPVPFPRLRSAALLVLLLSPLCVPGGLLAARLGRQPAARVSQALDPGTIPGAELQEFQRAVTMEPSPRPPKPGRAVGEDHGLAELLRSVDFWLYFMAYLCGGTAGLVFISNLGQISESRGHSKASALVSLSSSSGFFGRLASAAPGYFLRPKWMMVPRPAWMGALMVPMVGSFFALAATGGGVCLYVCTAVLGTCTGAITAVAVSTTSELFGLKNFGVNHNVVIVNIPLGSLLFGYVAGTLYDRRAAAVSGVCRGTDCYSATFLILGSVGAVGVVLCVILSVRTQDFYRTLDARLKEFPLPDGRSEARHLPSLNRH